MTVAEMTDLMLIAFKHDLVNGSNHGAIDVPPDVAKRICNGLRARLENSIIAEFKKAGMLE